MIEKVQLKKQKHDASGIVFRGCLLLSSAKNYTTSCEGWGAKKKKLKRTKEKGFIMGRLYTDWAGSQAAK
jgi:hypothetical protein